MGKWWSYIRYFFFLAFNWNVRLAWFIVRKEIEGEKKYQHYVSGTDDLSQSVSEADRLHASIYQPVNFYTAERLFDQIKKPFYQTTILDAGCGKGRVLAMAAQKGFTQIHGFDLSADMCMQAHESLRSIVSQAPHVSMRIEVANANEYTLSDEVSVIFLFNPFDDSIMRSFVQAVERSLDLHPRNMLVLYANPVHKQCWIDSGFIETFHFRKMVWLEGSVLMKKKT